MVPCPNWGTAPTWSNLAFRCPSDRTASDTEACGGAPNAGIVGRPTREPYSDFNPPEACHVLGAKVILTWLELLLCFEQPPTGWYSCLASSNAVIDCVLRGAFS